MGTPALPQSRRSREALAGQTPEARFDTYVRVAFG